MLLSCPVLADEDEQHTAQRWGAPGSLAARICSGPVEEPLRQDIRGVVPRPTLTSGNAQGSYLWLCHSRIREGHLRSLRASQITTFFSLFRSNDLIWGGKISQHLASSRWLRSHCGLHLDLDLCLRHSHVYLSNQCRIKADH